MFNQCFVPNCGSERKDVKLHKMPADRKKAKIWLQVISAAVSSTSSKFEDMSWTMVNKSHVCHKHFEAKYVCQHSMRLSHDAYPTLFTSQEVQSGTPSRVYAEIESVEQARFSVEDHTYNKKMHHDHSYAKIAILPENVDVTATSPMVPVSQASGVAGTSVDQTASSSADAATLPLPHPAPVDSEPTVEAGPSVDTTALTDLPQTPRKPPSWVCRKKFISSIHKLTPKCKELYKLHKKARRQLDYCRRAKMAKKASKEDSFLELVEGMNPVARKFLWMQVKLCTRQKKGRRFNLEEKVIALSIMKQSPKCYRFLQRIFVLPSKTTLNNLLGQVNLEAGINSKVFSVIKEEVSSWKESKKLCSIIFDEMKLEAGVHYSKKGDKISGFVELSEKTNRLADHALAFILKGAVWKWQQPMVYYFSEGAASASQMRAIIKQLVAAVCDTGLQPIALISDQGSTFQSAFKSLQEDTRRSQILAGEETDDTIKINGQCLSVVYDPPHLIKGIRNNFLTKNIIMDEKVSKWQDLVDVYRTDCRHAQTRLLHKLNDEHILPEKIKKMKVKNCVRVFSKTMAAALNYTASFSHYADGTPVSDTLEHTAKLVAFLDDLFDSVNGASTSFKHTRGKRLRTAVTNDSDHHAFWEKAIVTLQNIKFVDHEGKISSVPSLRNWVTTLRSFQRLWRVLNEKNINIMRPRYLNSDAIENFFGRVRSYNARNNDPSCHAFACTFKSLLVTNLIKFHENTYNCEDDRAEQVLKIQSLFDECSVMDDLPGPVRAESVSPAPASAASSAVSRAAGDAGDASADSLRLQAVRERLDVHSRAYTAGWVVRKVLKSFDCSECRNSFTTSDPTPIHRYIRHREYDHMERNKLTYPSVRALRTFTYILMESNEYLECHSHRTGLRESIREILLTKYSFDFITCETHREAVQKYFISVSITLCIYNWCNTINKILKGTDIFRLDRKNLPFMQAQALRKYTKSLKIKSLNKYMVPSFQKLFQFMSCPFSDLHDKLK